MTVNKSANSALKRTIDLGKIPLADQLDLIRVFRVGTGDEKAITVKNLILSILEESVFDEALGEIVSQVEQQIIVLEQELGEINLNLKENFTDLDDTEESYVGEASKFIRVSPDETKLIFSDPPNQPQYGVISGGIIQWSRTGLTYNASPVVYALNGIRSVSSRQVTLAPADATFDRFDTIGWNDQNEIFVITGEPSANPVIPVVDLETQVFGTAILVRAGETTPIDDLVEEQIYLENTEWTVTSAGSGTLNPASTNNPIEGAVSVEVTNIQNGFVITFDRGVGNTIDLTPFNNVGFLFRAKTAFLSGYRLRGFWLGNSGTAISNVIDFPIEDNNLSVQFLSFLIDDWIFSNKNARYFRITFTRDRGAPTYSGFWIDDVRLEGGIDQPQPPLVEVPPHNQLEGLQGGETNERYHVNLDQYNAIENANSPSDTNPFATIDDLSGGGGGRDEDAVHYDDDDGKSASEKQRARSNIDVIGGDAQIVTSVGAINNLSRTSNTIFFTGSGQVSLSGLSSGVVGECVVIANYTNADLILVHNNLSTFSNRIFINTNFNLHIPINSFTILVYNTGWNVLDKQLLGGRFTYNRILTSGYVLGVNSNNGGLVSFQNLLNDVANLQIFGNGRLSTPQNIITLTAINSGNAPERFAGFGGFNFRGLNSGFSIGDFYNSSNNIVSSIAHTGQLNQLNRSSILSHSIRRDEQRLLYLTSITTSGVVNDQALTDGIFNYRFTNAEEITGFSNGEIGRKITIQNDRAGDLILRHQSTGSIAANRINLIGATDLTIPTKGKVDLIYCTGSRWELSSKNF